MIVVINPIQPPRKAPLVVKLFQVIVKNSIGKLSIEVVGVADANNAPDLKADTGYVYEDFTLDVEEDDIIIFPSVAQ